MRVASCLIAVSLAALTVSAGAVQTPDFSGQWVMDPDVPQGQAAGPDSDVRGNMGSGWGSPIAVTQDAKDLVVEYTPFTRYDIQPPLRFRYALDGSEILTHLMIGHSPQERRSRTAWKGETLEITSIYPARHPQTNEPFTTEVVQRLSLASANELVVEVTRSAFGRTAAVTRTTYRRVTTR
jgi:hypothetical protein